MKFISVYSSTNKQSSKLELDQYYTSYKDMQYCVRKSLDTIRDLGHNISECLEPSAGEGVFSTYLAVSGLNVLAFDIEPKEEHIEKQDYLTCELEYKEDRLVIGNPPYGRCMNLAQKFYKKSVELGDYISFILPISQLNNTNSLYEFDLVYSEDLGTLVFSGAKKVHCCLNVYVRPQNGLNKKSSRKLKDITIVRQDKKDYKDIVEDIRICYWGDGTVGKVLEPNESYSGEYKIIIHNQSLKEDIINFFNTVDWKKELNSTAMKKIQQFHIVDMLRKYVPTVS